MLINTSLIASTPTYLQALSGELTVPAWGEFCAHIEELYNQVLPNESGNVAKYIPALAKVNPDQFAVSICTVDGQCFNIGDCDFKFGVQSCSKPVSYCMAMREQGPEIVHSQVTCV